MSFSILFQDKDRANTHAPFIRTAKSFKLFQKLHNMIKQLNSPQITINFVFPRSTMK